MEKRVKCPSHHDNPYLCWLLPCSLQRATFYLAYDCHLWNELSPSAFAGNMQRTLEQCVCLSGFIRTYQMPVGKTDRSWRAFQKLPSAFDIGGGDIIPKMPLVSLG